MKNTLIKRTLGLVALGLVATGTQAGWDHRDRAHDRHAAQQSRMFSQTINARQDRQLERIEAGRRNGMLSRAEYRRLMQEQDEIRAMARHFRADGRIDGREFRRLERALDTANRNIRVQQHDQHARNTQRTPRRYN